ncbi:hypothetical protein [Microbacterium barkeri]|uniref:hypothetical protein n=1 Tax=Microbacterium barkeri TaxID=33917 RepID=UPI0022F26CD0|nr:hypothetical protein [Microbacterium barkeri]MDR6875618.1 hypothetical protein [Microbacterium barkeri]
MLLSSSFPERNLKKEGDMGAGYLVNGRRILQLASAALAAGGALTAALVPGFVTVSADSAGRQGTETRTLLEAMGAVSLLIVLVPVLVACLPLLFRGRAWAVSSVVAPLLLALWVGIGITTLGMFFVPALVVSVLSLFFPLRARAAPRAA